jgi:hypothetical protein
MRRLKLINTVIKLLENFIQKPLINSKNLKNLGLTSTTSGNPIGNCGKKTNRKMSQLNHFDKTTNIYQ